jgi:aminopeptidase
LDPRIIRHARIIVDYSTKIKKGDNVLIQFSDLGKELAVEIFKQASKLGASCLIVNSPTEAIEAYYQVTSGKHLKVFPKHLFELVKASDVIISVRSDVNTRALSHVKSSKISLRSTVLQKIQEERMKKRWCLTQHPTHAFAQEADMSLNVYQDFVYSSIIQDWRKESVKNSRLKRVLDRASEIRLEGKNTDLRMSVRGRVFVPDNGTHNLPGGEIFTAPIESSVKGHVYFDLPAIHVGKEVRDIKLEFVNGNVVSAKASKNQELLKEMIKTDSGSKRIGELGIGTNIKIKKFTKNILFDEKIGGTIHLAIGRAYKECKGINKSAIHWDMIKTMKPGRIIVDGAIIQQNGKFLWNNISKLE